MILVLGGARSGKSRWAERLAAAAPGPVTYVATAEVSDEEMHQRIEAHRRRRPISWQTLEAPRDLADALAAVGNFPGVIMVDCLGVWIGNLLHYGLDAGEIRQRIEALVELLPTLTANLIVVSPETGLGLVPESSLGRRFRDQLGELNEAVAAIADRVFLVVAGRVLELPPGSPL